MKEARETDTEKGTTKLGEMGVPGKTLWALSGGGWEEGFPGS